ncbi:hypothetical protein BLAT2472_10471 [Burkholderia latens]
MIQNNFRYLLEASGAIATTLFAFLGEVSNQPYRMEVPWVRFLRETLLDSFHRRYICDQGQTSRPRLMILSTANEAENSGAPDSGSEGRGFESFRSDHENPFSFYASF